MDTSKIARASNESSYLATLKLLLIEYRRSGKIVPRPVVLDDSTRLLFAAFRCNPARFVASIFEDVWSIPDKHPFKGEMRIVAVVKGADGLWIVGRQGKEIFASRG